MNPYNVLDVEPDATDDQIKAAYRKLSKEHHPDRGGSAEAFHMVKRARDILLNPEARKRFDESGEMPEDDDEMLTKAAMMIIKQLVSATIEQSSPDDLKRIDIIGQFREFLSEKRGTLKGEIVTAEKELARLNRHRDVFKEHVEGEGDNPFIRIIDDMAGPVKMNILSLSKQIDIVDRAQEILKKFRFKKAMSPADLFNAPTSSGIFTTIFRTNTGA